MLIKVVGHNPDGSTSIQTICLRDEVPYTAAYREPDEEESRFTDEDGNIIFFTKDGFFSGWEGSPFEDETVDQAIDRLDPEVK